MKDNSATVKAAAGIGFRVMVSTGFAPEKRNAEHHPAPTYVNRHQAGDRDISIRIVLAGIERLELNRIECRVRNPLKTICC
jgi:hypothetical protein